MAKFIDMTDKTFGFYKVLKRIYRKNSTSAFWLCRCKCGKENIVRGDKLRNGKTQSCLCKRSDPLIRDSIFSKSYKILENGCWEWQANRDRGGYAEMGRNIKGKERKGHRFSYVKYIGEIPSGMCVCHKCDNRGCVNPDHLFLGTHIENHDDKIKKGRQIKGENSHYHKLNEEQVREIWNEYKKGNMSQRKLASKYDVNQFCIWAILKRKTWKHLNLI